MFGPTGNWSKDYTSEVQLGPVQGPMVQVIWSKDYTDPISSAFNFKLNLSMYLLLILE